MKGQYNLSLTMAERGCLDKNNIQLTCLFLEALTHTVLCDLALLMDIEST